MPRFAVLLVVALLPVTLLGGCLESEATTTIAKDGSGTYTQVVSLEMVKARAHARQVKAQARGLGIPADEGIESPFDVLDAKKRAAALKTRKGIRVTRSDQEEDAEKKTRTYTLGVAFDSLKQLFAAGVVEDVSVKLERVRDGRAWKLTIRHVFEGSERDPLTGDDALRLRKMREAMLARYKPLWGSLAISSTLNLPTKVLATNGVPRRTEKGNFVSWRIGFADLADAAKLVQQVTFEHAPDLKLEAFTLSSNDIANAIEEAELAAEEAAKKAAAKKQAAKKNDD